MGTRADFYLGRGKDAEWLGSIAWDGYPGGISNKLLDSWTEDEFKERLAEFAKGRNDWTSPADGWPWPWENSGTTDFAYAFDEEELWMSCFGREWRKVRDGEPERVDEAGNDIEPDPWPKGNKAEMFPDMTDKMNVTWGKRSGLMVIGTNKSGKMGILQED
jgi:hypothetical protein